MIRSTIDDAQIAAYARQAGFPNDQIATAVAVALAESSGNPSIVNYLGCVGLWQIFESVHKAKHPLWTTNWLKLPANNAVAAYAIWVEAGRSWRPWSTYTSGTYRRYLARGQTAAGSNTDVAGYIGNDNPLIPNAIEGPADVIAGVAAFLRHLQDPQMQLRIVLVIVGILLLSNGIMNLTDAKGKVESIQKLALKIYMAKGGGKK